MGDADANAQPDILETPLENSSNEASPDDDDPFVAAATEVSWQLVSYTLPSASVCNSAKQFSHVYTFFLSFLLLLLLHNCVIRATAAPSNMVGALIE